jgi:aryl-alcohol dehydrogenase-like predicted oxidoreductase
MLGGASTGTWKRNLTSLAVPSRLGFTPSRITLGSVQFGLAYGIANRAGQPSEKEVFAILDHAVAAGVTTIDTARGYGSSERRIGRWLATRKPPFVHVVTKVPALPTEPIDARLRALNIHLAASMRALGTERLPLVLVHEETDLLDPHVVEAFQSAVADNVIGAFGASVYRVDIAARLIETAPIAALQVPANVVDRRFENAGIFAAAAARGVAVFVRSVFLQGALLAKPQSLPAHLARIAQVVRQLQLIASEARLPLPQLLIPPIRDIEGVTSLVLGVDKAEQLLPHLSASQAVAPSAAIMQRIREAVESLPPEIIDASKWKSLSANGACARS